MNLYKSCLPWVRTMSKQFLSTALANEEKVFRCDGVDQIIHVCE